MHTHTNPLSPSLSHLSDTHTPTHKYVYIVRHTLSLTFPPFRHTHTQTHTHTHTHTHNHTHTHSLHTPLSLYLTHTHTHTHTHVHVHRHKLSLTFPPFRHTHQR